MKKIIAIVLCLLMGAMLTGCVSEVFEEVGYAVEDTVEEIGEIVEDMLDY